MVTHRVPARFFAWTYNVCGPVDNPETSIVPLKFLVVVPAASVNPVPAPFDPTASKKYSTLVIAVDHVVIA